jgi:hypothetical protein
VIRAALLSVVLLSGAARAGGSDDKMHIMVAHQHSRADAHARAQMLFDYWKQRYGVQCTWTGDSAHVLGKVMGIDINAVLVVTDDSIGGDAEDPGPFVRGIAKSYITKKLQKYMHPQYLEP